MHLRLDGYIAWYANIDVFGTKRSVYGGTAAT